MKYALMIYENEVDFANREGPNAGAYWAAWSAYSHAVEAAGVMAGGAGLQPPSTATTLSYVDGKHQVQDGPFLDSKDQLGGFYLIEVPGLDEAMKWAARIPISELGRVEVRPLLQMQSA